MVCGRVAGGGLVNPQGIDLIRVAAIIKQMGAALSAVHEKKIYHRDLKPENIMLQALARGDEQVKIVDFGIAKIKESLVAPVRRVPAGAGRRRRGADALLAAGHRPPDRRQPRRDVHEALTCGADVVVPAFTDGHAPGLHRVQDLGAGAVTFPSSANPEDLALLLAHHHGVSMTITVGLSATMGEFLDRGRSGSNASTFLTRLQTGGRVVDGRVVAALYRNRISGWAVLLLLLAVVAAAVAALLVSISATGCSTGSNRGDGLGRAGPGLVR